MARIGKRTSDRIRLYSSLLLALIAYEPQRCVAEPATQTVSSNIQSKQDRAVTTTNIAVALEASLVREEQSITVQYLVFNGSKSPIYVYDRLWRISTGRFVGDGEAAYRFFENGKLTLLLGAAPLPTTMVPTFRNEPEVRRVEAGGTLMGKVRLTTPVSEYSCYFDEPNPAVASDRAKRLVVLLEYVEASELATRVSTVDASARKITAPGVFEKRRTVRSQDIAVELDVLKRTGEFARPRM